LGILGENLADLSRTAGQNRKKARPITFSVALGDMTLRVNL
jgi:hypothetical protein